MSPKTLIIAAVALTASSAAVISAVAAPPADPAPNAPGQTAPMHPVPLRATILFNLLDRNGDGVIDQDELAALTKAVFSAVDANGDGKISSDEFDHAMPMMGGGGPRMGQFFHHHGPQFGMNGPGRGQGWGGPRGFHRPGEMRQGQIGNDQGPAGAGGPQQLGDNDDQSQGPGPQNFATLDKNGDGVLSPDEFSAGAPAMPGAPSPAAQQ
ncbi:MAG TPA: EF-hand domain-containing protein [Bauldia sp.]